MVHSIKQNNKQAEILMEALGPNLKKLKYQCPTQNFSKATALAIGIQLLERLEQLHSLNYVHNDLKFENVVIGFNNPEKIYLIDFGLSVKFVDDNGKHVEKQYLQKFSGNFLFASLNSCRGFNKSRRDDIESLFYMVIYLLNQSYLPWCDLDTKDRDIVKKFKDLLADRLNLNLIKQMFQMIPPELNSCLKKVLLLGFEEKPDYEYFKNQLRICLAKNLKLKEPIGPPSQPQTHLPVLQQFEWSKNIASIMRQKIVIQDSISYQAENSLEYQQDQRNNFIIRSQKGGFLNFGFHSIELNSLRQTPIDDQGQHSVNSANVHQQIQHNFVESNRDFKLSQISVALSHRSQNEESKVSEEVESFTPPPQNRSQFARQKRLSQSSNGKQKLFFSYPKEDVRDIS